MKPKGIKPDEQIAEKVREWYEDEGRKGEYDREAVMGAILRSHSRMAEEKPQASRDANIYGMHFTRFLREDLGLKP